MTSPTTAKASGRFSKWRRVLIFLAAICLAVALFYGEEDWRGKRAWENCRHALAARGQVLDTQSLIPPRVPDEQNVLKVPEMAQWFGGEWPAALITKLTSRWSTRRPTSTALADVRCLPPGTNSTGSRDEVVLDYSLFNLPATLRSEQARTNVVDTVAFDGVALPDAIRALAAQSGREVEFDPSLSATNVIITLRWKNVTVDQALSALLKNYFLVLVNDPETHRNRITAVDSAAAQEAVQRFAREPGVQVPVEAALHKAVGSFVVSPFGYLVVQRPLAQVEPMRLILRTASDVTRQEIKILLKEFLPDDTSDYGTAPVWKDGVFQARPQIEGAPDYLAWSDQMMEPDFDLMRQALQRPLAQRADYQKGPAEMPNFVTLRVAVQALAQRAQCHLLLSQPAEALRDLTLLHDLFRVCDTKPLGLTPAMMSIALSGLYTSVVADGLRLHAWGEPELAALEKQLQSIHDPALLATALATMRAFQCQEIEMMTPADLGKILTNSFAFSIGAANRPAASMNSPLVRWLSRPWMQPVGQWIKNWLFPANPWLKTKLFAMAPRGWRYLNMTTVALLQQELLDTIELHDGSVSPNEVERYKNDLDQKLKGGGPVTFLAAWLDVDVSRAIIASFRNQTYVNQAVIACALERHRLAHGHLPETLKELVPNLLDQLPRDLIGGQPLKYRRHDAGTFLLYSVGWNGKDDGGVAGQTSAEGDWVWPKNWP